MFNTLHCKGRCTFYLGKFFWGNLVNIMLFYVRACQTLGLCLHSDMNMLIMQRDNANNEKIKHLLSVIYFSFCFEVKNGFRRKTAFPSVNTPLAVYKNQLFPFQEYLFLHDNVSSNFGTDFAHRCFYWMIINP